jgi:hypothetical protein
MIKKIKNNADNFDSEEESKAPKKLNKKEPISFLIKEPNFK